jgi:hypothetical protein
MPINPDHEHKVQKEIKCMSGRIIENANRVVQDLRSKDSLAVNQAIIEIERCISELIGWNPQDDLPEQPILPKIAATFELMNIESQIEADDGKVIAIVLEKLQEVQQQMKMVRIMYAGPYPDLEVLEALEIQGY